MGGRFRLHRISDSEKAYKLCRVQAVYITAKKIPVLTTHDGRTIRYPPPAVKVHDASNHQFATRLSNIFIVGKDDDLQVSLPKGKGVKLSILEERKKRFKDKY